MITAEQFSRAFEQVTREQISNLLKSWPSKPMFTDFAKNVMMPSVASKLGCYRELEYKRIDVVFKLSADPRDIPRPEIATAIELENVFGKSHEEVTKLRKFNAPLGVLITYARDENHQRLLSEFAQIISASAETWEDNEQGELLVIFGPYGMTAPKVLTWKYFAYRENSFSQFIM